MARRHIHYEAAFEDFLRSRGIAYVPVDEQKKVIFSGARVKSFDFLIYPQGGKPWLVDVKGRKFPYETDGNRRYWENWVTRDDVEGLTRWKEVFGQGFEAVFVFAYLLSGESERHGTLLAHPFRDNEYAFWGVTLEDYAENSRQRSPKWETISLSAARFRELAKPLDRLGGVAI
jgi:hypothetical protein